MKVVLTQDVPGLGKAGEIKEVDDNYVRDYLLPRGYAALATKDLPHQDDTLKVHSLAQRLNGQAVRLTRQFSPVGRFYPITNIHIAAKIKQELGIDIDHHKIDLDDPIEEDGAYSVPVRLGSGVEAWLTVIVDNEYDRMVQDQQATLVLYRLKPAEAELLQKINQGLPLHLGQRYHGLIAKRNAEELTPDEHEELINLTDQVEEVEARRVEYLVELARLRNTSVTALIQELGIPPILYA